jgi:hypothetical protein
MQLVGERSSPDPEPTISSTTTIEPPATWPSTYRATRTHDSVWRQGIIASLNVAALVLSARLILMIAVFGAIGLTWLALQTESPTRLAAVGLYTVTVILPLVWLSGRG